MKLGSIFSDRAVLQSGQPIRLWGETSPCVLVQAEIAGRTAYAKSSGSGDFLMHIPSLEAGGSFDLTVSVPELEGETLTLHDILVGEVWLCSGQSNMTYCLGRNWAMQAPTEGTASVASQQGNEYLDMICPANEIRFVTVPMQVTGSREKYFEAQWRPMTRENALEASAVAAWFGARIREHLNVPIGLICCSWGGSVVEAWTSTAALRSNPDTRPLLEYWEALRSEKETWLGKTLTADERIPDYAIPDRGNQGQDWGWASPELDDSAWSNMLIPGNWMEQGIGGNGAVWIRRKVTIPAEQAGRELLLQTGGIDKHDIAYFNGVEIGRTGQGLETQFWNQPRCYRIPGELVHPGENTIAIRAFSFAMEGAFGGLDKNYVLSGTGWEISLTGIWKAKMEYDLGRIAVPPCYGVQIHNTPGLQFDSMVRPLLPFAIKGVIWYQGESNASTMSNSLLYQRKLETMIRDWRFHWDLPDLPFLQVQLADYCSPKAYDDFSHWAVLRDAQEKCCSTLPNVFLCTALGIGDEEDIHPQNKKDVGFRLAALALHHVYNEQEILPSGPVCTKVQAEEGGLRVFFQFADNLELRDAPGKSFYLAGADGRYFPADAATVCGDSILLSSRQLPKPLSVRYAWSDNPNNILYNSQYPAAAFSASVEKFA